MLNRLFELENIKYVISVDDCFADTDEKELLTLAPKGGGSEIFGTFYRMFFPADGEAGIKKFVIECIKDACYAGKVCPPAIIGVGIGGTFEKCAFL